MSDRITLAGIEVFGHHGVLDDERALGQLFVIDLELELDLSVAGESDDLIDTVDYGDVAARVQALVASGRWNLIETVAQKVADLVLEDPRVGATTVTVHKPEAPIEVPFHDVAVTVRRTG